MDENGGTLGMVALIKALYHPKGITTIFPIKESTGKFSQPGVVLIIWPSTFHLLG